MRFDQSARVVAAVRTATFVGDDVRSTICEGGIRIGFEATPDHWMTHDTPLSLATITAADFASVRGRTFRLSHAGGDLDLRLHEVRPHEAGARAGGGFSLTFVGAKGPHLAQALYPLTNETLGTLEIFLVPIGPVDGGNGYEAVFA